MASYGGGQSQPPPVCRRSGQTGANRPSLFNNGLLSPNGKLAFFNRTKNGQDYGRLVDVARSQPIGPAALLPSAIG